MEQKDNEGPTTTSPQKHMKHNRSKSTEEMQAAKKALASQKSLPGRPELSKVKECSDDSDTPASARGT